MARKFRNDPDGITARQRAFVDAYLLEPQATAAARAAGYSNPGVQGPRMMRESEGIQRAVRHALAERNERNRARKEAAKEATTAALADRQADMHQERDEAGQTLAERVTMVQTVNVDRDYVLATIVETIERCKQASIVRDARGRPRTVETPDGDLHALYAYSPKDVLRGCELLGKHLGMFGDVQVTPSDGLAELLDRARNTPLPIRTVEQNETQH